MKIETAKKDESAYIRIDAVTENVAQRLEDLCLSKKRICITEIMKSEADALDAKLVGHTARAVRVVSEAHEVVGGGGGGGIVRLYLDPVSP